MISDCFAISPNDKIPISPGNFFNHDRRISNFEFRQVDFEWIEIYQILFSDFKAKSVLSLNSCSELYL